MNPLYLTLTQLRYVNKAFWRNPASAFFTFAFPLMFLVIFTSLLGHGTVHLGGRTVHQSTYYVAAMGAYAVISACYMNIAISLCVQRDAGILKRTHGTPLPTTVYFAARVLHALLVAVLLVAITVAFGRLFYFADCFDAGFLGSAFRWSDLLIVGSWGFGALVFARFRFSWEPRT